MGSRRLTTVLALMMLLTPWFSGGFHWYRYIEPDTPSNPAYTSILAACARGDIEEFNAPSDWNGSWLPSTSEGCAPRMNGTLVITLDDQSHLPSWWSYRDQFNEHGLRLTMFIDRSYHLNETEWYWLQAFQEDGHEIGIHSQNHTRMRDILEDGKLIERYIEIEVLPEIETFESHGIHPTAFAYPSGDRSKKTDAALLEHFQILRTTEMTAGNEHLRSIIPEHSNQVVTASSMDREYRTRSVIISKIQDAAEQGQAFVTYGHRLDPDENPFHTTEPDDLFEFAAMAKTLGMRLATLSDLASPYHAEGMENMYSFMRTGNISIANRMLENCWILPRFDEVCFEGEVPTWREDPFDENYWRFVFYSLRPLSHLLYAWETTADIAYRDRLIELIRSFSQADELSPWIYAHHADKHGAAFRAMMLTEIRWTLAHDHAIDDDEVQLLESLIHVTATYLMRPENFQSGYNHGFNQAAGLLSIAINHPWLRDSLNWDRTARERLQQMMEEVVDDDGVMIESSPYYHFYVLLIIADIIRWGDENNIPLPEAVSQRFAKMLDYATDVAHPDQTLPLIGASIPGSGLKSGGFDSLEELHDRLAWIRSGGERGDPEVDDVNAFYTAFYPISGHAMLRSSWAANITNVSHVVIDAGPYRTSHSDYDHFGITWFRTDSILVDPGLYSYEDGERRDYFHGTSAHSVVMVDGTDQPENYDIGETEIYAEESWGGIISSIQIQDWRWTRAVIAIGDGILLVFDDIQSSKQHEFDLLWHLSPNLDVTNTESGYAITDETQTVIAQLLTLSASPLEGRILEGETNPLQGWVADHYESMIPAPVIEQSHVGTDFRTVSLWIVGAEQATFSGELLVERPFIELQFSGEHHRLNFTQDAQGSWTLEMQPSVT